jgi:hypothetical protein
VLRHFPDKSKKNKFQSQASTLVCNILNTSLCVEFDLKPKAALA